MKTQNRSIILRAVIFISFLAAVIIVGLVLDLPSVEQIRADARAGGVAGAALFAIGYGLITLTPLPKAVLSIAAGVIWGFGAGLLIVYLGALIGAGLAFTIGRALGRDAVEKFTGARIDRVDRILRRRGLLTVIGARLIPVLPFTVINYAAGLTSLRRRDYAVGTMIGIIPGTMAYVGLGAFGTTVGWQFDIAIGALGVLTLVGVFAGIRLRRRTRTGLRRRTDRGGNDNAPPGDASAGRD